MHLVNDDIPLDGVFHGYDELDNERIDLDFCWVPLEDLKNDVKVYPQEWYLIFLNKRRKLYILFQSKFRR